MAMTRTADLKEQLISLFAACTLLYDIKTKTILEILQNAEVSLMHSSRNSWWLPRLHTTICDFFQFYTVFSSEKLL